MSDNEWDLSNQAESHERNTNGDRWGGDDNGNREGGSSRGRGRGRGGSRGGSRGGRSEDGGGRGGFSDGNNDFGDDQQPPVSDKPRPTYIPPEFEENDSNGIEAGMNFNKYEKIAVKVCGESVPNHIESFQSSGLREVLISNLTKSNYTTPTPVQKYAIPIVIKKRDMMASAQTGSGKTVSIQKILVLLYLHN